MLVKNLKESLQERSKDEVVIQDNGNNYSIGVLVDDVENLVKAIQEGCSTIENVIVGVAMKSSYEWIVSMLGVHFAGATLLPVPIEFSDEQVRSLLDKADLVLAKGERVEARLKNILPNHLVVDPVNIREGWKVRPSEYNSEVSRGLSIIHTSGTTATPKGVIISESGLDALLESLWPRIPSGPLDCASVVPMSLLIEQVVGAYFPLLTGGKICFLPEDLPEFGAESTRLSDYVTHLESCGPCFGYLPPVLVNAIDDTDPKKLPKLKDAHIITGGASLQATVLESLSGKGFRVFEAYGMSENSSMISLNYPGSNKIGTAGKLLPHVSGRVVKGELKIYSQSLCLGYYNSSKDKLKTEDGWFGTGDLCEFDDEEYLKVVGRRKHLIILSSARNVSAEWVENTYKGIDGIEDMVVMGEGKPELGAIILSKMSVPQVKDALSTKHQELANYAQVSRFLLVNDYVEFRQKYYTVTGRPRRSHIFNDFHEEIWSD